MDFRRRKDPAGKVHEARRPCIESEEVVDEEKVRDVELLKGNVPTADEWQEAWSHLSETASLRKGGRIFVKRTRSMASGMRWRKRVRKQLVVLAEVIRKKVRGILRQATSIALALDECKYRKVIRFRCDCSADAADGGLWRHAGASGFSQSGVVGILDCSKKHAEDFEEDHAVTGVKQMDDIQTRF